jgi:hypothetical protein
MEIILKRVLENKRSETTYGQIFFDNNNFCSLELLWKDNLSNVSCIPEGKYELFLAGWGNMNDRYLKKFPDIHKGMIMLRSVPNREGILIHMGTKKQDSKGCIIIGSQYSKNTGMLTETEKGYVDFYKTVSKKLINQEKIVLNIINQIEKG